MTIMLATDTYSPGKDGPARLVKRLADDLSVEHDVHVVHPSCGRQHPGHGGAEGATEHRLRSVPALKGSQPRLPLPGTQDRARAAVRLVAPDVVHVHSQLSLGRALEATASGLPVGAVGVGASSHLVRHGRNGLRYRRGDVRELTRWIGALLDDPDSSRRMSRRSRAVATRHDATVTQAAFLSLYGGPRPGSTNTADRPMALTAVDR